MINLPPLILLVAGLLLLLIGGELLVRGAVSISGHLRISSMVIGITVVSFGTSVPELVVSMEAAFGGHPDISVGNVVGSNIANIALVLAITILILPYNVDTSRTLRSWIYMLIVSVLLLVLSSTGGFVIGRIEGIALSVLLLLFVWHSLRMSGKESREDKHEIVKPRYSIPVSVGLMVVASIGLVFGADLLIGGATTIAERLSVSERVISVSVVAFGTSLPELATSAVAAYRKENEISLGNIIGSNIFNILGILGITAMVKPINVTKEMVTVDMIWMVGFALLLMVMILPLKGGRLTRLKGVVLLLLYAFYMYIVFK